MHLRRFAPVVAIAALAAVLSVPGIALAAGVPVEPGTAAPQQFSASNGCGCHASFVEEWTKSMHAKALVDPLYQAKLAEGNAATDGKLGAFCNTCHAPAATMMGEMAQGQPSSPGGKDAIACDWCHHVSAMKPGEPGNTSHLVEPAGPRRAQLQDPNAPHPAAYSALHDSAEFCGGCHNVNHPVNGMHLESTYREWKESAYATEGVTCQDCHMAALPGGIGPSVGQAAGGAQQRDNIYHMIFSGAQVELGNPEYAKPMLQKAATVEVDVPNIVAEGEKAKVKVTITNSGAGHYLPTGLTEVREMWLEVTARGEDGKDVKLGEHRFGTILQDATGKAPAELWEATAIKSDDRIPPRGSVTDEYDFEMPKGAQASDIQVALRYRSSDDDLAAKAGVKNPVTDMAVVQKMVYSSDEAYADAQSESGTSSWMGLVAGIAAAGVLLLAVGVVVSRRSRKQV